MVGDSNCWGCNTRGGYNCAGLTRPSPRPEGGATPRPPQNQTDKEGPSVNEGHTTPDVFGHPPPPHIPPTVPTLKCGSTLCQICRTNKYNYFFYCHWSDDAKKEKALSHIVSIITTTSKKTQNNGKPPNNFHPQIVSPQIISPLGPDFGRPKKYYPPPFFTDSHRKKNGFFENWNHIFVQIVHEFCNAGWD